MKHLEPVVKKSSSYSILFLRDDSKVVSFRLKPFWIKFLAIAFFIFSAASGTAGYAAHYYWKKYHNLQRERTELTAKLGENRRQLGRFAGVERIKEATLPRSSMVGVPSITTAPEGNNGKTNGTATPPQNGAPEAAPGTPKPADPPAAPPEPAPDAPKPEAPSPPQAATPPPGTDDAPPGYPAENTSGAPETGHPGTISEVQLRPAGNKTFKLSFGLNNRDQQLTLNGRVLVAVRAAPGEQQEITQVSRDSLRFIINRYKKVTTEFVLPADLKTEDVTDLYLTIVSDGQPSVTYTFPVPTPP